MSSSKFASTFAPYTPPPDDPLNSQQRAASTSKVAHTRPWFPSYESSVTTSYQSGGVPTFGNSYSASLDPVEEAGSQNQWETTYGLRVDALAAFAYLLGPISALVLLIVEVQNDYIRFHAYQSALLTTPLLFLRIFGSLVQFPSALNTVITVVILISQGFMTFQAFHDAAKNGLTRFYLPYIGHIADSWVSEE